MFLLLLMAYSPFDEPPKQQVDNTNGIIAVCSVLTLLGGAAIYVLGKAFGAGQFEAASKSRFNENQGSIKLLSDGHSKIWEKINQIELRNTENGTKLAVIEERSLHISDSLRRIESSQELIRRRVGAKADTDQ